MENLLKNPDPSRAKDYSSIEKYKQMLKDKIARLKKVNESGDPFRDIVKKNAAIYRDHELARREKEDYARWLAVHKPDELKKKLKSLKKK